MIEVFPVRTRRLVTSRRAGTLVDSSDVRAAQTLAEAESLLIARMLEAGDADADASVDTLCVQYPELATELKALANDLEAARSALGLEPRRDQGPRYEVRGLIGRGGMGSVFEVFDRSLQRTLAMKVIGANRDTDATLGIRALRAQSRLQHEAQILAQLDHPGVVPVHEVGRNEAGQPYFTMQLVRGRDFASIIELVRDGRDGWTLARAVGCILRVCDALAYAHSRGVIHRDLKPSNVMVGRWGETYVMDWGLAKARSLTHAAVEASHAAASEADTIGWSVANAGAVGARTSARGVERTVATRDASIHTDRSDGADDAFASPIVTAEGDVVGTPAYMAPEQALGHVREVDEGSDVYGVGALLYHLLAGRMPYATDGASPSSRDVLRAVRAGPPAPLSRAASNAPEELVAIAEKAMARDPAQRYASAQELGDDLRAWLEGRVVRAHRTGAWTELKKWVARNRGMAMAIAAAILVALLGLGGVSYVQSVARSELEAKNTQVEAKSAEVVAKNAEILGKNVEVEAKNTELEKKNSELLRLADRKRLSDLIGEADRLWPAEPRRLDALNAWLVRARELAGRVDLHRATLDAMRAQGRLASEGNAAPRWRFDVTEDQWQHDTLSDLLTQLEAFAKPEKGQIHSVERRIVLASTIEQDSITSPDAAARWREAIASIADPAQCPAYGGLAIRPQIGLVPIGRDEHSGLWEFAHLPTGTRPERDPSAAKLAMTDATGLVFVLIPGGRFKIGAQKVDPAGVNYDPDAIVDEGPVVELALDPFFMSKYEMTQAQWQRVTGTNPSDFKASEKPVFGKLTTLHNPVEGMSWDAATQEMSHLGFDLPTEAQWEYAARGGTSTPWWTGADAASVQGASNVADGGTKARGGPHWWVYDDALDDGYCGHAPVDAFLPNAFGLHGTIGNVQELCRDKYAQYDKPFAPGTGLRTDGDPVSRVARGGNFSQPAVVARSATRNLVQRDFRDAGVGLRPARRLDP